MDHGNDSIKLTNHRTTGSFLGSFSLSTNLYGGKQLEEIMESVILQPTTEVCSSLSGTMLSKIATQGQTTTPQAHHKLGVVALQFI